MKPSKPFRKNNQTKTMVLQQISGASSCSLMSNVLPQLTTTEESFWCVFPGWPIVDLPAMTNVLFWPMVALF
jgi:hypothetical protein